MQSARLMLLLARSHQSHSLRFSLFGWHSIRKALQYNTERPKWLPISWTL